MDDKSQNKGLSGSHRVLIALASFAFGAGLIVLVPQMDSNPEGKSSQKESSVDPKKKPSRSWNIALGNVVVVAPDLGFNTKVVKGGQVEESKITARLESQLQGLREFYREQSESDPSLMGGMLLQLTVNSSGEVTHVKDLVSRITDSEFKKAVLAEVFKWTFPEIIAETTTINCPLLFVREGMDITTVVQWEKTLGQFTEKSAIAKMNAQVDQESQVAETKKRTPAVAKTAPAPSKGKAEQNPAPKSFSRLSQIKHPTAVRAEPNFESTTVGKFTAGTKVTVLAASGDWVEVRADDTGLAGFIRKEFATPIELTK
ncbi:MAG TPA: AgmX/PglI C-terminal domain-containing protein [Candidatus Binatia bacterium]